ncbi:MAG: class I SAM-dependent methyltransferase [Spirochaetia bacterium]
MWFEDEQFWIDFKEMMYDPQRLDRTYTDVQEMIKLCALRPSMRVLDHCCGFGRHALTFAQMNYHVCGVDLCAPYLDIARKKSLKYTNHIDWYHQDIRNLQIPHQFDFIYNFFTSFGYVEDAQEELEIAKRIYDHLKPGGKFLIDMQGKELFARDYKESEWFDGQDASIMLVQTMPVDNWCRIENRWGFVKEGVYTEQIFAHKLYSAQEIASLLSQADFLKVECYGSLSGTPYDMNAERLIVVATKE